MYRNIGRKIKGLAITLAVLGMLASVGMGLSIMFVDATATDLNLSLKGMEFDSTGNARYIVGALIAVFGVLFSWIGSWFTYGIGSLIDNAAVIAKNTDAIRRGMKNL